jgi:hypothetical protein
MHRTAHLFHKILPGFDELRRGEFFFGIAVATSKLVRPNTKYAFFMPIMLLNGFSIFKRRKIPLLRSQNLAIFTKKTKFLRRDFYPYTQDTTAS